MQLLAGKRSEITDGPQRRLLLFGIAARRFGQLDVELAHRLAVDHQAHVPCLGAGAHRKIQVTSCHVDFATGRLGREASITFDDLINIDVPPASFVAVDDFDDGLLVGQVAHVPRLPVEMFVTAAGRATRGRAHDFAADEQVDAGLGGMMSAADEKVQVSAFDLERGRRELAGGGIAADERIGQPMAKKAVDLHLVGKRPLGRRRAERLPLDAPGAVVGPFEIPDHDVLPFGSRQRGAEQCRSESCARDGRAVRMARQSDHGGGDFQLAEPN